jgi:ammonium transporter, Amt family
VFSGSIPWLTMNVLGKKMRFFQIVDDTLGVFHTHLVAGLVGGFLVGIFATEEGCLAFAAISTGGAITGNGKQVGEQLLAFAFIVGWNVVITSLICCFIQYVCRIPLRMSEDELLAGDDAVHGEAAYSFNDDPEVTSIMRGKIVHDDFDAGSHDQVHALSY